MNKTHKRTIIGICILCVFAFIIGAITVEVYKQEKRDKAMRDAESQYDTTAAQIPLASSYGMQHYEIRIPGRRNAVAVTEFIDKQGHHCVLVMAERGSSSMVFSCDHK